MWGGRPRRNGRGRRRRTSGMPTPSTRRPKCVLASAICNFMHAKLLCTKASKGQPEEDLSTGPL